MKLAPKRHKLVRILLKRDEVESVESIAQQQKILKRSDTSSVHVHVEECQREELLVLLKGFAVNLINEQSQPA